MKKLQGNYYAVVLYRLLIALLLYTICRFIFFGLNTSLFPNIALHEWINILKGGFRFDVAALFYFNALILVMSFAPIPNNWRFNKFYQKIIKILFYILNGFAIFLNLIDTIFYRFTLRRTTLGVLKEFKNEQNGSQMFLSFISDYWFMVLIFFALTFLMVYLYNLIEPVQKTVKNNLKYYIAATIILLITVPIAIYGIRGDFGHSTRPITISDAGQYVQQPNNLYLVLNTPFVFIRTLKVKGLDKKEYFTQDAVEKIYSPNHYSNPQNVFQKKNVVLLILESFGKEASGFYNAHLDNGTYKGFTPFLDSLAKNSYIFWNSFANGRKSIDAIPASIASIPSGLDPFALTPYVSDSIKSLGHILKEEGYYTAFFHGAPNGSMGFSSISKILGMDHYFGKNEYGKDEDFDGMWGIWDEPFLQFTAQTMKKFQQPFFTSVFTVSSHHPFKVPKQYEGVFKKGPNPLLECNSYSDMALQKFFHSIQNEPWFQNTLFVITADHASMTSHPEYQTAWGEAAIPILFYAPGDSTLRGVDSTGLVQQIDIMPTTLSYLNYNKPYLAFGNNAFESSKNGTGFVFNYLGGYRWFTNQYALFFDGEKSKALYDYKNDRLFKTNLITSKKAIADTMEHKLKAFIQQYNNRLIENRLLVK